MQNSVLIFFFFFWFKILTLLVQEKIKADVCVCVCGALWSSSKVSDMKSRNSVYTKWIQMQLAVKYNHNNASPPLLNASQWIDTDLLLIWVNESFGKFKKTLPMISWVIQTDNKIHFDNDIVGIFWSFRNRNIPHIVWINRDERMYWYE